MEKPEKRKRDPTFLPTEKALLVSIINDHITAIESKKTDAISSKAKLELWKKIAAEFNSNSPVMVRDLQVLRNLWDNLKKKAKSAITINNQNTFATGEGPQKKFKYDPIVEQVISLIRTNISGFKNVYDSDGLSTISVGLPFEDASDSETCNDNHDAQVLINGDWSSYTPALLRTPRATVLPDVQFLEAEVEVAASTTAAAATTTSNIEERGSAAPSTKPGPTCPPMSSRHLNSQRRPVLRQSAAALLAQTKIKTLEITNEQAAQQHELMLKILKLQEVQEMEKVKQEKEKSEQERLKTKILKEQLRKLLESK